MKKANNGFKYKADKDFYEAALKDNPGAGHTIKCLSKQQIFL